MAGTDSITITRTIHPVGQGAFYSETFKNADESAIFTAVYDCGGKKECWETDINTLEKNVDILFISHFHSDHINGVPLLIEKKKPKLVVIPQLSPAIFLVDFVSNCMKDKSGEANSFMLRTLPLMSTGNGEGHNDDTKYELVKSDVPYTPPTSISNWEYVAFYKEDDVEERKLADNLSGILGLEDYKPGQYLPISVYQGIASKLSNEDASAEINQGLLKRIRDAYDHAFKGNHNSYSMLVLSHEVKPDNSDGHSFDCLYTGDVFPDEYVLQIVTDYAPDYIQVPHHGSNCNHNNNLYRKDRVAFMSVGETNRYRHPGLRTLIYIYDNSKEIHVVTEHRRFQPKAIQL